MLDYKDIIVKHYVLHLTGAEIARQLKVSKSGVNDFLRAFKQHESLLFPLPEGITYGIAELVYGHGLGNNSRDISFELPDFEEIQRQMQTRKNMTLVEQWNRYMRRCEAEGMLSTKEPQWIEANEARNKGAFVMDQQYMDADNLLARSRELARKSEEDM